MPKSWDRRSSTNLSGSSILLFGPITAFSTWFSHPSSTDGLIQSLVSLLNVMFTVSLIFEDIFFFFVKAKRSRSQLVSTLHCRLAWPLNVHGTGLFLQFWSSCLHLQQSFSLTPLTSPTLLRIHKDIQVFFLTFLLRTRLDQKLLSDVDEGIASFCPWCPRYPSSALKSCATRGSYHHCD